MAVWRLIVDGPVDGALNMALDRAAQLSRERGFVAPTLRLYRWARPTVTLGRFQPAQSVDFSAAEGRGVDVVRRFTGGRGVLHSDELTYSVIAAVDDGVPRGVAASYRRLCNALAGAYRTLGVDAELVAHDASTRGSAACYLASTRADLSLGARKLSGSAQVWSGDTVMQHGSFVRSRDVKLEAELFKLTDAEQYDLREHAVTMSDAGCTVTDEDIVRAISAAFAREFGVRFVARDWTASEFDLATSLLDRVRVRPTTSA